VQNDKAIEVVIIIVDDLYEFCPVKRFHIRRVNRRVELIGGDPVIKTLQFGDVFQQVVKVEVF
jgi:hypothetical protein